MPDFTSAKPDAAAIIDAARRGQEITLFDGGNPVPALAFIPTLGDGKFYNLESYQAAPFRKRGKVVVYDADSLNKLIAENFEADRCTIYCHRDPVDPSVVAVLNGAGKPGPGWSDHRVEIEFRPTPQWQKWMAIDGKMMAQVDFAEFIEDNLEDISQPTGAEMLEIAQYLQATRTAEFKSGVSLANGTIKLTNIEDIQATVGAGEKAVPALFYLAIAPIFGADRFSVPARFRFRVNGGKLTLGFKLQRVEDVMQNVLDDVIGKIAPREGMAIVDGRPPAAAA